MINTKVDERNLFRLAALVYGNSINDKYTNDTLLSMIENAFLDSHNQPMEKDQLLSKVLTSYNVIITEAEFDSIIEKNSLVFDLETEGSTVFYTLKESVLIELQDRSSRNIEYYIDSYIEINQCSNSIKEVIYKFLYQLTTTNIVSYQKMLGDENGIEIKTDSLISVEPSAFTDYEREIISGFLSWENEEKNIVLTNIVLCCLEYCLVISGDRTNELVIDHLKERYVYLDTNILFRALGINGIHRKDVVLAFLSKCNQANMRLFITTYTKREFFDTVNYYVQRAIKLPSDNIYEDAYEELCDYNLFTYYYEWKRSHPDLPLKLFNKYVESSICQLFEKYSIEEDNRNIYGIEAQKKIEEYDRSIRRIKESDPLYVQQYFGANKHDAILAYIAEQKRREVQSVNYRADCLIATSDKQFRFWDYSRMRNSIPLLVYPSQLFALLIKLCGRSTDDMKSFVSFINIKPSVKQLPALKANAILSAISSLSDDFSTQKLLVSAVFDDDFQKVIQSTKDEEELYEMSKEYGKKIVDEEMARQSRELEKQIQMNNDNQIEIKELRNELKEEKRQRKNEQIEYAAQQSQNENESVKQEKMINTMALKHTCFHFHFFWTFIPLLSVIGGFGICILFAIGLLGKRENNITLRISEYICSTPLVQKIQDPYAWLVPAAITVTTTLLVFGIKRLFSSKRKGKREEYKENYLKRMQQ